MKSRMIHIILCLLLSVPMLKTQPVYAPEKEYVHLDRTYFAAGETLWLKGYVVSAAPVPDSRRPMADGSRNQTYLITLFFKYVAL